VKVKGDPQPSQLAALAGGVRLADGTTNPADVHILRQRDHKTWLSITLAEGKNRQVRRMCEAVGLPVEKLVRVAFGGLRLGALPPGRWRYLESAEVELLRRPAPPPRPARPPRGRQRPSRQAAAPARGGEHRPGRAAAPARVPTRRARQRPAPGAERDAAPRPRRPRRGAGPGRATPPRRDDRPHDRGRPRRGR
jgi:hypothetical protein